VVQPQAGGGAGNAAYQINPGPAFSTAAYGWGTDGYGLGGWGEPSTVSNVTLRSKTMVTR
jgi:hypothetical protein